LMMYAPTLPIQIIAIITFFFIIVFGYGSQDSYAIWNGGPSFNSNPKPTTPNRQTLNILVLSIGTRGDVQPFLTLGQELKSRGHIVTVCGFGKHRELVERYGLQFLDSGIPEILQETISWRRATHVSQVMELSLPDFSANFLKLGSAFYNAAIDTNADLLIATSTTQSFVLSIAEKINKRAIVVKLAPDLPTRDFPAPGYRFYSLGIFNYFTWLHHWILIAKAASNAGMGPAEELFRKKILEIPPLKRGKRLKEMGECASLCAFSKTVVPSPRDWPGNALITGWWFASRATPVQPRPIPQHVSEFLGNDGRVVCVTFGSMSPAADASGLVELVARAVVEKYGKFNIRLFVIRPKDDTPSSSSAAAAALPLPRRCEVSLEEELGLKMLIVDEAPHNVVFPRCRLVVHHGGAGTCASVLESGVPAIIVPVLLWTDQPLWGELIQRLHVAKMVHQEFAQLLREGDDNKLLLEQQIQSARNNFIHDIVRGIIEMDTDEVRQRCLQVAKMVCDENGVSDACDAIERLVII
jgi:sterol 3beta-glucosyltransferase